MQINPSTNKPWRHGDTCKDTGRVFKQYDPRKKGGMAWYGCASSYQKNLATRRETYAEKLKDRLFAQSERSRKKLLMRERRKRGVAQEVDRRHKQSAAYRMKQAAYSKRRNSTEEAKQNRREREATRTRNDELFKLRKRMRCRLYQAMRVNGWVKNGPSERMIGCTYAFLKTYLEARFKPGMTWENYGSVWHVDHVIPLASATTKRRLEQLCRYSNLAPEFAAVNIAKGAKQLKQMPLL